LGIPGGAAFVCKFTQKYAETGEPLVEGYDKETHIEN
jgi:hypothetical protein